MEEERAARAPQSRNKVETMVSEVRTQSRLHWNYLSLWSLPPELTEEGLHVEEINLKCNVLTRLPENFGRLKQLTCCYLNSNNLEYLPDSIGELQMLSILDVGNNNLKALPLTLARLPVLRSLVLVHNELTSFPPELCGMTCLTVLMLSGNYITSLPEAIRGLTGLMGLYVDHNLLRELPRSLSALPMLTRISCCCNNLTYLPALTFRSKPQIYYDNCEVNYLPFSLVCQLNSGPTWDPVILQTCGYFPKVLIEDNAVCISLSHSGRQRHSRSLVLPPQIRKVSSIASGSSTVPPLEELCLILVYRMEWCTDHNPVVPKAGQYTEHLKPGMLPRGLLNTLEEGPVSRCNNSECQLPVFTYASILVVTISVSPRANVEVSRIPMLFYFCSDICAVHFSKRFNGEPDYFSSGLSERLKTSHKIEIV